MGLFDLRCGLSGLSTRAPPARERFACSMVLLREDEAGERFVPVLYPITGTYDGYGRLELDARDAEHAHAEWMGCVLELLWDAGTLSSSAPSLLRSEGALGGVAATLFAHASDSIFNAFTMTLEGRRVIPCLFRDDVARAIASAEGATARPSPLVDAWRQRNEALARSGLLDAPPAVTAEVAERFQRVLAWAEARGALRPIARDDAQQHTHRDLDRFAQAAWDSGDPVLRSLLLRFVDDDARLLSAARVANERFDETARERALAAHPVEIEAVRRVLRSRLDEARAASVTAAIERSPARARVLEVLSARRPRFPAALAEVDGATVKAGDALTEGEEDIHDVVRILGARVALARIVAQLAPLLALDRASLQTLVEPMLSHLAIQEARLRVTDAQWERWWEAGNCDRHPLTASLLVSSYGALAAHVDPTWEEALAEADRRQRACDALVACGYDEDGYFMRIDVSRA